jgi:hypothetical protein
MKCIPDLAEVAVLREPVSTIISLISGKNTGNFADSRLMMATERLI